jgi:hypothetical protein
MLLVELGFGQLEIAGCLRVRQIARPWPMRVGTGLDLETGRKPGLYSRWRESGKELGLERREAAVRGADGARTTREANKRPRGLALAAAPSS